MINYERAAIKASETLVKYAVLKCPVSPLPILEKMGNVLTVSFEELGDSSGIDRKDVAHLFGKCRDAVSSVHMKDGQAVYVVAYNGLLPYNMLQRALARELGHIVLGHRERNADNEAEAECFAKHFLCPRPVIHTIQAISMRMTEDLLGNLTGIYQQSLVSLRKTPGVNVPPGLNRFVRDQFMPFILNFFEYYRNVMPQDGSALVDFGTFMDNYVE